MFASRNDVKQSGKPKFYVFFLKKNIICVQLLYDDSRTEIQFDACNDYLRFFVLTIFSITICSKPLLKLRPLVIDIMFYLKLIPLIDF